LSIPLGSRSYPAGPGRTQHAYCSDRSARYKIERVLENVFEVRHRGAFWPELGRIRPHLQEETMTKSHDTKKDKKKPAQKTAKEKKLAKREKKRG
jgi:hypothetical protein